MPRPNGCHSYCILCDWSVGAGVVENVSIRMMLLCLDYDSICKSDLLPGYPAIDGFLSYFFRFDI